MADPTLQTFCCVQSNETRLGADAIIKFRTGPYNIVCVVSAVLGIIGATYQILPRDERFCRLSNSYLRGRKIVVWLAAADLLAALALLIRSLSWLLRYEDFSDERSLDTLFCAISSGWIQYFYTAACLWTFCYAFDVLLVLNGLKANPMIYQLISWGFPFIFTTLGLSILYYPDLNCHKIGSNAFSRILPNYIFSYLPIVFVMLANPIIYIKASRKAEDKILSLSGRFTHYERKQLRSLNLKFISIIAVFFICWLPNLVNAFLLWTLWTDAPQSFLLFDWYLIAFLNPLQALLNAIVYRKWGDNRPSIILPWKTKLPNRPNQLGEGIFQSFNYEDSQLLSDSIDESKNYSSSNDLNNQYSDSILSK